MSEAIFTKNHLVEHDATWTFQGKVFSSLCVLCVIDRLNDPQSEQLQLTVFVKIILNEMTGINESLLIRMMDRRNDVVFERYYRPLFAFLLPSYKSDVHQLVIKVLIKTFSLANTEEHCKEMTVTLIQNISSVHNFNNSTSHLSLLGQFLHMKPTLLTKYITRLHGAFIWYLLEGLTYPDVVVKSLVVYTFVQLISATDSSLPYDVISEMCNQLPSILADSRTNDLTVNLMGLLQALICVPAYAKCLLLADNAQSKVIPSALKKVLLSNDEVLQYAGVQCITNMLTLDAEYMSELIVADLPVYLFEILLCDNDGLINLVMNCLLHLSNSSLGLLSSSHITLGYDALFYALEKSLFVKNYTALQSGMLILISIVDRPSSFTIVLKEEFAMKRILAIITSSVPHVPCYISACLTAKIMKTDIVSKDRSFTEFLPLLSVFLKHIPMISSLPSSDYPTISLKDTLDLQNVLLVFKNLSHLLFHKGAAGQQCVISSEVDDVFDYLVETAETHLIPLTLLYLSSTNVSSSYDPFQLLKVLLQLLVDLLKLNSPEIAVHLVQGGLIQLVMDYKSKCDDNSNQFEVIANNFIEELCCKLLVWDNKRSDVLVVDLMKSVLRLSLPNISCSLNHCLKFLPQKVPESITENESVTAACQKTILCLLYYLKLIQKEPSVSAEMLLIALDGYLTLNPEANLPSLFLKYLISLYLSCCMGTINHLSKCTISDVSGEEIISRYIIEQSDPSLVFTQDVSLLIWVYRNQLFANHDTPRLWLLKWLEYSVENEFQTLLQSIPVVNRVLDDAVHILKYSSKCHHSAAGLIMEILKLEGDGLTCYVVKTIENDLESANVNLASLLGVLKSLPHTNNLTFVSRVITILSSLCSEANGVCSSVLLQGLQVCSRCLEDGSLIKVQVSSLLLNNDIVLRYALSHLQKENELDLTAVFIKVISLLLDISQHDCTFEIPFDFLLNLLLSTNVTVACKILVLDMWSKILSNRKIANPFFIIAFKKSNHEIMKSYQMLAFVVTNLISMDDLTLVRSACNFFTQMLFYVRNSKQLTCHELLFENWLYLLCRRFKMQYTNELLPPECHVLINEVVANNEKMNSDLKEWVAALI